MASILAWQKAADTTALAAAHRVKLDIDSAGGPSKIDVETLVGFTISRAEGDLATVAGLENLITELDAVRSHGKVTTIGAIQERLRTILAAATQSKTSGERR